MSDKEQSPFQSQPVLTTYYPMHLESKNDDIGLFELIAQVWRKKWWILGCMLLSTSIAGIYTFTAKEQWTATAVVDVPTYDSISNYYNGVRLIEGNNDKVPSLEDISEKLFKQFINQLISYNELSQFVLSSDYFKKLSEGKSQKKVDKLLNEFINAVKLDKEKDSSIYNISISATSSEQAKELLTNYIKLINNKVSENQYTQLQSQLENRKDSIKKQMDALKTIAKDQRLEEIENIKMALSIAENANIIKPELNGLNRLDGANLFLLGKDALNAMLNNIEKQPLALNDLYYGLQRQYIEISSFSVDKKLIQPFSYLKNPTPEPEKDKPKTLIIILLGLIIGLILGVCGVLGNNARVAYYNNSKIN